MNHAGCPLGIPVSLDSPLVHLRSVKAVDELAAHGVRVNAVSPGMTDTSLIDDIRDSFDLTKIPLGRFGTPEETAECVCFLLGDAASYVSGANVRVGGGRPPGTFLG